MALATRIDHKIAVQPFKDVACVRARYRVEGTDKILIALSWMSPAYIEDAGVVGRLLESMDKEAEEDAAHPEDILTAGFFCT